MARRIRRSRLFLRLWLMPGVLCNLLACTGIASRVDPAQAEIAPETYLVAFSFDTRPLDGPGARGDEWPFIAAYVDVGSGPLFDVSGERPELSLVLLDVPGPSFAIRAIELVHRKSEFREQWYKSSVGGPVVELTQGAINYVGSLVVERASVGNGKPGLLELRIADAWQADAVYWRHRFPLLRSREPVRRITPPWSESGLLALVESRARGQPHGDEPFIYKTMRTKRRPLPGSEPD